MTEMVVSGDGAAGSVAAARPGDRHREFSDFYTANFRDVSGYCAALLKDGATAGDVAQEAFERLFARWSRVRNPRGFVYLVATNLVRDEWRRRGRNKVLLRSIEPLVDATAPAVNATLTDIVARLPRRLREVVVLHVIADIPVAEIATLTSTPMGTVKSRLREARARLRLDWLEIE